MQGRDTILAAAALEDCDSDADEVSTPEELAVMMWRAAPHVLDEVAAAQNLSSDGACEMEAIWSMSCCVSCSAEAHCELHS